MWWRGNGCGATFWLLPLVVGAKLIRRSSILQRQYEIL
jgi:hypothetical protein